MSISKTCELYGMSRQNYYKLKNSVSKFNKEREKIISMIIMIRRKHSRLGIRKIFFKIKAMLQEESIKIGRDGIFRIAREAGYLVKRKLRKSKTTRGGRRRFDNHLKGKIIEEINQAWVSDITYLRIGTMKFAYLFLIMDLYSRRVIGYKLGKSLEARHGVEAMKMAIRTAKGDVKGLIHHSDHGIQYISKEYTAILEKHGMVSSMGEVGNAYDNAYAERVIGTLKNEYGLSENFNNYKEANLAVKEAVFLYNNDRPHLSLDYATPAEVYDNIKTAPAVKIKDDVPKPKDTAKSGFSGDTDDIA